MQAEVSLPALEGIRQTAHQPGLAVPSPGGQVHWWILGVPEMDELGKAESKEAISSNLCGGFLPVSGSLKFTAWSHQDLKDSALL